MAEQGGRYSVDFESKHKLAKRVSDLKNSIAWASDQKEPTRIMLELLEEIIEYEGTLGDSLENQYIVFHFLALRHLRADGGFPPPTDTTQALAHLQWGFRLVMYAKIRKLLAAESKTSKAKVGLWENRTKENRETHEVGIIREALEPLRTGAPTQMGTIHSMKGVLRYHAEAHPRAPLARWDDLSFTKLYCEGAEFDLAQFRKMNRNMVERGWNMLKELLLDEPIERHMTWPGYVHDLEGRTGDRYSFLVDERNGFSYIGGSFATRMLVKHFAKGSVNDTLQCQGVSAYLARAREFLNLIAAMMHLTGGGAPRAEEAVKTRILEGTEGGRNLFFLRDKIAWVLTYNKSKAQKVSSNK